MPFKLVLIFFIHLSLSACSVAPTSLQTSTDIKACNAISYGNKHADIQSIDSIYQRCMSNKNKMRINENKKANTFAIIDFFLALFDSNKNEG